MTAIGGLKRKVVLGMAISTVIWRRAIEALRPDHGRAHFKHLRGDPTAAE
jgi:hypothetical protein